MIIAAIVLSLGYLWLQLVALQFLFRRRRRNVKSPPIDWPGISVVTSLKGCTEQLQQGLECILKQTYPGPVEFIIVVQESSDPVVNEAKNFLRNMSSHIQVRWITDIQLQGLNPRSAKMFAGINEAKYPWIYWHAIDSIIERDHLRDSMIASEGCEENYVTTFPVIIDPKDFGSRIEAMALNLEVSKFFAFGFMQKGGAVAYGGALLAHRKLLEKSGALAETLNRLTDDIVLAKSFKEHGGQCLMAPGLAFVPQRHLRWRDFIKRQVRWMMIARHYMKPLFFISPLFWLGQIFLLAGLVFGNCPLAALGIGIFGLRIVQLLVSEILLGTPKSDWKNVVFLPLYDLILPFCWLAATFTRRLSWSGDIMVVGKDGILVRPAEPR